jgi:hypothetical protein
MFTPAMILLMTLNTVAASGAALVALQASLSERRTPFFPSPLVGAETSEARSWVARTREARS